MLEFMKRIGIFIICAQSLLHFSAGKDYEKYIKLLIGMMILGQFVVPIRELVLGEGEGEIWSRIAWFQEEMESITSDIELPETEDDQITNQVYKEIKSKLYNSAYHAGYDIKEIQVSGDSSQEKLTVLLAKKGEKTPPVQIEAVSVQVVTTKTEKEEREEAAEENPHAEETKEVKELRTEFGRLLGIDEAFIEIRMDWEE